MYYVYGEGDMRHTLTFSVVHVAPVNVVYGLWVEALSHLELSIKQRFLWAFLNSWAMFTTFPSRVLRKVLT